MVPLAPVVLLMASATVRTAAGDPVHEDTEGVTAQHSVDLPPVNT